MNWAWEQKLAPSIKIVLLALADIADDQGTCWPSIPTIARKVCTSQRTVQRVVHKLGTKTEAKPALIRIVPRSRSNGSRSSNVYLLQMAGDNLSPEGSRENDAGANGAGEMTSPCRGRSDTGVTRAGDKAESPPEPPAEPPAEPKKRTTSGRPVDKQLSAETQRSLVRELSRLDAGMQSELMSQLAEGWRTGAIRSPAGWMKAAVDRITKSRSAGT